MGLEGNFMVEKTKTLLISAVKVPAKIIHIKNQNTFNIKVITKL